MISPRYFREIPQRYRLEAGRCRKCGKVYFPPRGYCGECKSKEFETIKLSETGKILTYKLGQTKNKYHRKNLVNLFHNR